MNITDCLASISRSVPCVVCLTTGTCSSASGGTFDNATDGTFHSATAGTFNPLLSSSSMKPRFLKAMTLQQSRTFPMLPCISLQGISMQPHQCPFFAEVVAVPFPQDEARRMTRMTVSMLAVASRWFMLYASQNHKDVHSTVKQIGLSAAFGLLERDALISGKDSREVQHPMRLDEL